MASPKSKVSRAVRIIAIPRTTYHKQSAIRLRGLTNSEQLISGRDEVLTAVSGGGGYILYSGRHAPALACTSKRLSSW